MHQSIVATPLHFAAQQLAVNNGSTSDSGKGSGSGSDQSNVNMGASQISVWARVK